MLITNHWSATSPVRIRDYHIETALTGVLDPKFNAQLGATIDATKVDWAHLKSLFTVWKNTNLTQVTSYGTWHMNSDPRDGSANIEIGALCMGGEGVSVAGPWGKYPYTYAHAWMQAAISARVCHIKGIDPLGKFTSGSFQNGPIFNISTHAERAIQTPDNPAANLRPSYGYFAYSGDPDCRWDIAARDVSLAPKLATPSNAYIEALASAVWIRAQSSAICAMLNSHSDMWGIDQPVS